MLAPGPAPLPALVSSLVHGECAVVNKIRDALGSLTGAVLAGLIILALMALPVLVVLWIGIALGVPDAAVMHARVTAGIIVAFDAANSLLPTWAWFGVIACSWLAFLDVHVRWLVRDELAKQQSGK
jgi:hypothetical protein